MSHAVAAISFFVTQSCFDETIVSCAVDIPLNTVYTTFHTRPRRIVIIPIACVRERYVYLAGLSDDVSAHCYYPVGSGF